MENIKQQIIEKLATLEQECRAVQSLFQEFNSDDIQGVFNEDVRRVLQKQINYLRHSAEHMGYELEITLINKPVLDNIDVVLKRIDAVINRKKD